MTRRSLARRSVSPARSTGGRRARNRQRGRPRRAGAILAIRPQTTYSGTQRAFRLALNAAMPSVASSLDAVRAKAAAPASA
jgi:hypothetical protein